MKVRATVRPYFRWYDLWIGAYIERVKGEDDRLHRVELFVEMYSAGPKLKERTLREVIVRVYIQPLPMIGVRIDVHRPWTCCGLLRSTIARS